MAFVKKSRKRQYRRREEDGDTAVVNDDRVEEQEEEEDPKSLSTVLEDIRDLQKMRNKSAGLSAAELALGREIPREVEMILDDPLKLRSGGVIELKKIRRAQLDRSNIEDDIKQQFSKESHLRDEDEEMRKFVEEELLRRTGKRGGGGGDGAGPSSSSESSGPMMTAEDALFRRAADTLKKYQSKASEEMLSNQMLSGIPEVDLGIEARIKNIEETEAKKQRMLKEAIAKQRDLEKTTMFHQDIVKDLSSNYVQHKIFDFENCTELGQEDWKKKERKLVRPDTQSMPVVTGDTPTPDSRKSSQPSMSEKPSDKRTADKFKQKFYEKKH
uniref:Hepatocellular carcinoma-associated antigen 59 n=1 Tax=Plectus sambesii TaxID=2011161 RepID=A0A914WUM6_9BILA